MATRHRSAGIQFRLLALALPVICGLGLLTHHQAAGRGQPFSAWLAETYGLRHGPGVSQMMDRWVSALSGAAGPSTALAATPPQGSIRLEPVPAVQRSEIEDPNREIRRLLAGRPGQRSMAEDYAAAKLALARELAEAAGLVGAVEPTRPEEATPPVAAAEPAQGALLIRADAEGEQTAAIRMEEPEPSSAAPVSLAPERRRIFVHYSKVDPRGAQRAEQIADHLRAAGHQVAAIRSVPYPVKRSSIRFFFSDDAEVANGLRGDFVAGLANEGISAAGLSIKDFRHYRPSPKRGTIEVWIPISR